MQKEPAPDESPVDVIIRQIHRMILHGEIEPGDRLPPERKLAETLGVSRGYVREAIKRLEFYGIVRTLPQSGTMVAGLGTVALDGLINNVLQLHEDDFASLVETRHILEVKAARLSAMRRTEEDLLRLTDAKVAYEQQVSAGKQGIDEDLLFHLKIAEASKNDVLKSLMMMITPNILRNYMTKDVCGDGQPILAVKQHQSIFDAIAAKDPVRAESSMAEHLDDLLNYE